MYISRHGSEVAGRPPTIGGTAMAISQSAILIGSESGLLLRCSAHANVVKRFVPSGSLRWEQSALEIVQHLPSHIQPKLCKHVENWAELSRKHVINARDLFSSKPKLHHIFPPPAGAVTVFDPHVSEVSGK